MLRRCQIGFGYDPLANDYKIIEIYHSFHRSFDKQNQDLPPSALTEAKVHVYSLSTDSQKFFGNIAPGPNHVIWCCPLFRSVSFNGFVHWLAYDSMVETYSYVLERSKFTSIVAFDLNKDVFKVMILPNCITQNRIILGEALGCLSVVAYLLYSSLVNKLKFFHIGQE